VQFEANIDDMDPRLWPRVIDRLLAVGADDAWVTPIVMKKGRPAHTLGVLCSRTVAVTVRDTIFVETTTIGLRELPVTKHVLHREVATVEVLGHRIGVKIASHNGVVVNRSVEWDDVEAAAGALGISAKEVLAAASAALPETATPGGDAA
jgi:uncharacterized protein (DUF111 family)